MSFFRNWDNSQIIISLGGVQLLGLASGTTVKVARMTPTFKSTVGSGGDVVRSRSRDKRATVTITVLASSPANDYLSSLHATDMATGNGVQPLLIKDLNGSTVIDSAQAWPTQPPDAEFSDEQPTRDWVIECADADMFIGGSNA